MSHDPRSPSVRAYLVVDDNHAFAENVAEILRDRGDEVVVASTGREALDRVAARRFDAVLTDMLMPVMGGAALVRELRRIDPDVPVLAITAHASDDVLDAARREGLLAVLPKPVDVGRLLELLAGARRTGLAGTGPGRAR